MNYKAFKNDGVLLAIVVCVFISLCSTIFALDQANRKDRYRVIVNGIIFEDVYALDTGVVSSGIGVWKGVDAKTGQPLMFQGDIVAIKLGE